MMCTLSEIGDRPAPHPPAPQKKGQWGLDLNMRTHLRYGVLAALHRTVDLAVLVELDVIALCLFGPHLQLAKVDCEATGHGS